MGHGVGWSPLCRRAGGHTSVDAPVAAQAPPFTPGQHTIRQIVRPTLGGDRVRIVFSNVFGTSPLTIGAASVALRERESSIVISSAKGLAVGGRSTFTVPAGATMTTDPVSLGVAAGSDLAVDIYVPDDLAASPSLVTMHNVASQTNYASVAGNHVGARSLDGATTFRSWFLIARVEVASAGQPVVVATFGDSITDGVRTTPDTNGRWPDHLARRLASANGAAAAVLNVGMSGNRLLSEGTPTQGMNALARFDRDVVAQPGITHVVVLEGINDIGAARSNPQPSVADLIAAHMQLIERAHARGLRIYGATLTPFEGAGYFTAEGEAKRQGLNQWIRTSGAYDGVIDFDAATRDPAMPSRLAAAFDSGDHLHPNDAGYRAMGEAVPLTLFSARPAR